MYILYYCCFLLLQTPDRLRKCSHELWWQLKNRPIATRILTYYFSWPCSRNWTKNRVINCMRREISYQQEACVNFGPVEKRGNILKLTKNAAGKRGKPRNLLEAREIYLQFELAVWLLELITVKLSKCKKCGKVSLTSLKDSSFRLVFQ